MLPEGLFGGSLRRPLVGCMSSTAPMSPAGAGWVIPDAARSEVPGRGAWWPWLWVLPGDATYVDPAPGGRAVTTCTRPCSSARVRAAVLARRLSEARPGATRCGTRCDEPPEAGYDLRTIQELLGHRREHDHDLTRTY